MAVKDETLPQLAPASTANITNVAPPRSQSTHPRNDPREWHRRGLRTPAELHALVAARIDALPHTNDPTNGDFLGEPTA